MQQYGQGEDYYAAMEQYEENQQAYYQAQMEYRQNINQNNQQYQQQQQEQQQQYQQQKENGEYVQNYGLYGAYVAAPETDDDGVVAMCSALFQVSAQCNVHMNSYERLSLYMVSDERPPLLSLFFDRLFYISF